MWRKILPSAIINQITDMPQKPIAQDWSKARIRFAVHERGLTFKGLTLANGYRSVDAVAQCLHRPYPKVERILAEAISARLDAIWPSRYRVTDKTKPSRTVEAGKVYAPVAEAPTTSTMNGWGE